MRPQDQQRFAALIAEFVLRCGVEPPFHLVAIGANGAVSVSHHRHDGGEEVCSTAPRDLVAPIVLTVIATDGRGKSAVIEIEAGRGRMRLI
jgi:hypothetical protein